ncbi:MULTISPECIES: hypothetical protein [unclassified Microbacterium]|uniref:hypothetical protein n=1 Tax=unclassified Microbacterium TaxID=2609290 RepID=UPI000CFE0FEC|nr:MULTISPECIES: hypothetical protein [unclassified Microbacterium]PQZ53864.1 hypothetical protein CQ032_14395 [Microbacterium sp. MYb43]PQZ76797.1 hypothetical protein CQ031_12635 [Microbacterium sp. MYb40]PRB21068.1 hypothetical protein CQ040_09645 [Microbacterium sp. MYb54]PRB25014.1 hypothetical protein CQ037_15525 [Microbacterium sp. MYb50]PRB66888.1 hypothetical protein CQ021_09335 [Microbacterium sp. MYb24]
MKTRVAVRATIITLVLLAATLPLLARIDVFHDAVWAFWGVSLVLVIVVLALSIKNFARRQDGPRGRSEHE